MKTNTLNNRHTAMRVRAFMICTVLICMVSVPEGHAQSRKDISRAAYQTAVSAIVAKNFVLMADLMNSTTSTTNIENTGGTGSIYTDKTIGSWSAPSMSINPDPRDAFVFLKNGEIGHFQVHPIGFVLSGKASDIKINVKPNGDVLFSMRITSDLSGMNVGMVNITMKKGSNKASGVLFLDRGTYKLSYAINGHIVPLDSVGLHVGREKSDKGKFMSPFDTYN